MPGISNFSQEEIAERWAASERVHAQELERLSDLLVSIRCQAVSMHGMLWAALECAKRGEVFMPASYDCDPIRILPEIDAFIKKHNAFYRSK